MDKIKQIDKLLEIKELRRKLAEMEVAKARRAMHMAQLAYKNAKAHEQQVKDESEQVRQERLEGLLEPSANPALVNARIANVYDMTGQEIGRSKEQTQARMGELGDAEACVKTEQVKLARFMQVEERTRKLCERLVKLKQIEAARTG